MSEYCYDDTKPEYYDAWRRLTESGEHDMSSIIPKSFDLVDIPQERWPDFDRWAWDVFMGLIKDFDGKYSKFLVGDLRRMVTFHDRRTWVWDHNGCGDFVRISSQDSNDRLIVVFDHESSRSPFGDSEGYPPGFDFLQPVDLRAIAESDTFPYDVGVASATEVYRFRYGFGRGFDLGATPGAQELIRSWRLEDPDRLITSPEVAALKNDFSPGVMFGSVYDDYKYLTDRQKQRRPRYVELYERLLKSDLPTLAELHDLLADDLVTAVAFDVMHQIADWMLSPEELHQKWANDR